MASKYENQTKVIGGLEFTSHEYKNRKLRVTVTIGKTIYQHFVCTQTWKNAKDSKQSTFNRLSWRFKKYFKIIKEEIKNYLPVIYKPVQKDFLTRTVNPNEIINKVDKFETIKDIRKWFKDYAKYYHPDFLGRKQSPFERDAYNELVFIRDEAISIIKLFED